MKVRLLGSLLLLALVPASGPAQDAPPATSKPPAQPPVADLPPAPVRTVVEDAGTGTTVIIEPAGPERPGKAPEEPASVKSLWRYGDGGEYLLWYIKNSRVPALVVGSPGAAVAGGSVGGPSALGPAGSRVLFGDTTVDMEDRSGGLFTLSTPLNAEHTIGFHGTYFFLGSREVSFLGGSGGSDSPTVGRPYVDAATGADALRLVAAPGYAGGAVHVSLTSRLQGVEANGVGNVLGGEHYQIDLLTGFRFLQLVEGLAVHERATYLAGAGDLAGTTFATEDRIRTGTCFYGGQVGTRLEFRSAGAFMNFTGKLGFGDSVETVRFSGTSVSAGPGGTTVTPTGDLFSLRSNVGHYTHESFALLPEFGVRVGYDLNEAARFFVGYTLVYLSDVVRPADQIDPVVNLRQATTGPNRPAPSLHTTDFWAQGLTIGFEYSY